MPSLPISRLQPAGNLNGTELFAVVQDGITKYTTLQAVNTSTTSNYGLYNQTGSSIPVTGVSESIETSGSLLDGGIGALTVPANAFKKGDAYHARISGKITIANNHDLEIDFKSGDVNLVTAGPVTMAGSTNKNWILDVTFIIQETGSAGTASILSSGDLIVRKDAAGEVITEIFSSVNNTTFDTTIDNTLGVEAVLDAACIASENIYSEMFTLHKIY